MRVFSTCLFVSPLPKKMERESLVAPSLSKPRDDLRQKKKKRKSRTALSLFLICCGICCVISFVVIFVLILHSSSNTATPTTVPTTTSVPTSTNPLPTSTSTPSSSSPTSTSPIPTDSPTSAPPTPTVSPTSTPSSPTPASTTPAPTPAPPTPAPTPAPCTGFFEICNNGIDDNCNELVDEQPCIPCGDVCSSNNGTCQEGIWECAGSDAYFCSGILPVPEICFNGLDEDCDGIIDNPDICNVTTPPPVACCGSGQCSGGDCIGDIPGVCSITPGTNCCDSSDCPYENQCLLLGQCTDIVNAPSSRRGLCVSDSNCRDSGSHNSTNWRCIFPPVIVLGPLTGVCANPSGGGSFTQPDARVTPVPFCGVDGDCGPSPLTCLGNFDSPTRASVCSWAFGPGSAWDPPVSFVPCNPGGNIPAQCGASDNFCINISPGICGPPTPAPPPIPPPPKCNATLCAGTGQLACCPTTLQVDCCFTTNTSGLCTPDPSGTFFVGNTACRGFCPLLLSNPMTCGGCEIQCGGATPYCCPNGPINSYGNRYQCSATEANPNCPTNFVDCYCNGTCYQVTSAQNCGACGNVCPQNSPVCCTAVEGNPFCTTQQECNSFLLNGLVLPSPQSKKK